VAWHNHTVNTTLSAALTRDSASASPVAMAETRVRKGRAAFKGIFFALLIIVAAVIVASGVSALVFATSIRGDIAKVVASATGKGAVVTADQIAALPAPVARYLTWSGVVGKPIPAVVRLTQSGHLRGSADDPWMDFQADETYATAKPAFVWRAYFPSPWPPLILGRDEYVNGKGSIAMRLLGVLPVASEQGDQMKAAALIRYLNEMVWFPAAFVSPGVHWTAIDDTSASVSLTDGATTVTGTMAFDAVGRPVDFLATRYNTGTGKDESWETPFTDYGAFGGVNVPVKGSGVWKLADGDLTYIELSVTGIEYDPAF
jgi:hypothetical protein